MLLCAPDSNTESMVSGATITWTLSCYGTQEHVKISIYICIFIPLISVYDNGIEDSSFTLPQDYNSTGQPSKSDASDGIIWMKQLVTAGEDMKTARRHSSWSIVIIDTAKQKVVMLANILNLMFFLVVFFVSVSIWCGSHIGRHLDGAKV